MIQIKNLQKSYGDRVLFGEVSFNINPRDRIGLVGRNGSGKSTLMKIISGEESQDSGEVSIAKGYRLSSLKQFTNFKMPTVSLECLQIFNGDENQLYKVEEILFGLGFTDEMCLMAPGDVSSGYQLRINLAKALLSEPNLLLLDEPTNYLDIITVKWLTNFLSRFQGELLLITHDKSFMDSVCNTIMGIHRRSLKKFPGTVDNYYKQIHIEDMSYESTRVNQEKKIKHMQDFVEKFRAKASKATQAQSKLKAIDKIERLDQLDSTQDLNFTFNFKEIPSKQILEAENRSFTTKKEITLFNEVNFNLNKNDVLGVIGKNGKGKSTFLNSIFDHENLTYGNVGGSIKAHPKIEHNTFGQTGLEQLHHENTILDEIRLANDSLSETRLHSIAGTMLFKGDDSKKKIKVLSGGEKSRVLLGKILARPCNVLLLDEPTNHLDIESIESLILEIKDFKGGIILVTHSEYLLRQVCNKLLVFKEDSCEFIDRDYNYFLDNIGWKNEPKKQPPESVKNKKCEIKQSNQKDISESKRQKEIADLEEKISTLEANVETLTLELQRASVQNDGERVEAVSIAISKLESQIEDNFKKLESLY